MFLVAGIRSLYLIIALAAVGSTLILSPLKPGLPIIRNKPMSPVDAEQPKSVTSPRSPADGDKSISLVESLTAAIASAAPVHGTDDSGPSFDVVRIDPTGDAVIAGRAAPGSAVELVRDGKILDRTVADQSGNFVMTPSQLPAGNYELKLRSLHPDGKQELSKGSVAIEVMAGRTDQPTVARLSPDWEPTVLVNPTQKPAHPAVTFDSIEAGKHGKLFVAGRGTPGATIRFYLNESYLASSKVGIGGRLEFKVDGGVRPGEYRIKLEEMADSSNAIKSRIEAPIIVTKQMVAADTPNERTTPIQSDRMWQDPLQDAILLKGSPKAEAASTTPLVDNSSPVVVVPSIKTTIVQLGDSLWRISQETYGSGLRYPFIYHANQKLIRNPHLIYPNQIFVIPETLP